MAAELAIVVGGGLFSSTLLALLVIPVIYSLFAGLRRTSADGRNNSGLRGNEGNSPKSY